MQPTWVKPGNSPNFSREFRQFSKIYNGKRPAKRFPLDAYPVRHYNVSVHNFCKMTEDPCAALYVCYISKGDNSFEDYQCRRY